MNGGILLTLRNYRWVWIVVIAVALLLAAILLPQLLAYRVSDVLPVALEDIVQILIGELPVRYSDPDSERRWRSVADREDVAQLYKLIHELPLVKGSEYDDVDTPAGGSPMYIIYILRDGTTLQLILHDGFVFTYGDARYAIQEDWLHYHPFISSEIDEVLEGYVAVPYAELDIAQ